MSKAVEERSLQQEKLDSLLAEVNQKVQAELVEMQKSQNVVVYAFINPIGPAQVGMKHLIEPKKTWLEKLRLNNFGKRNQGTLQIKWAIMQGIMDKYKTVLFALITPNGAELKLGFKDPKAMLEEKKLWTPPDIGKIIPIPQVDKGGIK